ncbi:hypothetical protein I3256_09150 [Photobacterium damselae]|uniref:hypothetical protein n=1 Tax=Photobacterium damselae TaxID=38293 RepID=UPI001EE12656|nr:hypothetical protein [Photobacterium damselae]MCG3816105.1 hypothetical protein [Photobacterium damselae]
MIRRWPILVILICLLLTSKISSGASSHFQKPIQYGGEQELDAWYYVPEANVPIVIRHIGDKTPYYIEVDEQQISDIFYLKGEEEISIDVPIKLKNKKGAQFFKICSVAFHGSMGSRICTKAELFLIQNK